MASSTPSQLVSATLCRISLREAGRLRERNALLKRLAAETLGGGFTAASARAGIREALSIFDRGNPAEAITRLENLIAQLETTTEFDAADSLAVSISYLGQLLDAVGQTSRAIPLLEEAVRRWEGLGEKGNQNLAAALGNLANALGEDGRLDEGLAAAERTLAITR